MLKQKKTQGKVAVPKKLDKKCLNIFMSNLITVSQLPELLSHCSKSSAEEKSNKASPKFSNCSTDRR